MLNETIQDKAVRLSMLEEAIQDEATRSPMLYECVCFVFFQLICWWQFDRKVDLLKVICQTLNSSELLASGQLKLAQKKRFVQAGNRTRGLPHGSKILYQLRYRNRYRKMGGFRHYISIYLLNLVGWTILMVQNNDEPEYYLWPKYGVNITYSLGAEPD